MYDRGAPDCVDIGAGAGVERGAGTDRIGAGAGVLRGAGVDLGAGAGAGFGAGLNKFCTACTIPHKFTPP